MNRAEADLRGGVRRSILPGLVLLVFLVACASNATRATQSAHDAGGLDGAPGDSAMPDGSADRVDAFEDPLAPHLLAPLSTTFQTSTHPTLRWRLAQGANGARVEICRDRACTNVEQQSEVMGTEFRPTPLSPGVHFWRASSVWPSGRVDSVSPTWEFFVPHVDHPTDQTSGVFLDVNGDGLADIVETLEPEETDGYVVFFGRRDGGPRGPDQSFSSVLGYIVGAAAALGDINGDGFGDVGISWRGLNNYEPAMTSRFTGQVQMLYGSPTGLRLGEMLHGHVPGFYLGYPSMDSAGDLNQDGYADIVFGSAPGRAATIVPPADPHSHYASVFLGGIGGVRVDSEVMLQRPPNATDNFGNSVAGLGDVTGDGYPDIYVAEGHIEPIDISSNLGSAFVYKGGPRGIDASASITLEPLGGLRAVDSGFSDRAAICDFNGDGSNDLALNLVDRDGAWLAIFSHPPSPGANWSYEWRFSIPPYDTSGRSSQHFVASCSGDLNGDAFADVIVSRIEGGPWWIVFGAATRDEVREMATDPVGVQFAAGGDFDGDTVLDVCAAYPGTADGGFEFRTIVFSGNDLSRRGGQLVGVGNRYVGCLAF